MISSIFLNKKATNKMKLKKTKFFLFNLDKLIGIIKNYKCSKSKKAIYVAP